jgi:creatinine amidohydrolase
VTDDTGVGDPSAATAAKGARFLEAVTSRLADFLVELSAMDPTDLYVPDR